MFSLTILCFLLIGLANNSQQQRSTPQGDTPQHPWAVAVNSADTWLAGFVGRAKICLTFQNNGTTTQDCKTLPWNTFEKGKSYATKLDFCCNDTVSKITLQTLPAKSADCPRPQRGALVERRSDHWHVKQVSVQSMVSGVKYTAEPEGMTAIVPYACPDADPLALEEFEITEEPIPCPNGEGGLYKHEEQFEQGCNGYCKCKNGSIMCVSMCPPSIAPHCHQVYVPGQCCQHHVCDATARCQMYEENDCDSANKTAGLGELPWSVFIKICDGNSTGECKKVCGGSLIHPRWVLTSSECVKKDGSVIAPRRMRIIAGELSLVLAEDIDVAVTPIEVQVSPTRGSGLALLKLPEAVESDRSVQIVALPTDRDRCLQLTQGGCSVTLSGWVNVGTADAENFELYKLSTRLEEGTACGSPTPQRKRKPQPPAARLRDPYLCVSMIDDDTVSPISADAEETPAALPCANEKRAYLCSEQQGLGLVSKILETTSSITPFEVNYLVGVVSYTLPANMTSEQLCNQNVYRLAISICPELAWITSTTTAVETNEEQET